MTNDGDSPAFSFTELLAACDAADPPPPPIMIPSDDGIDLAVRVYKPASATKPRAVLIFYHGGGAHSGAGYQLVAQGLSRKHGIIVYTPDLRGHGASGGPRGDAPSVDQVFRDISTVVEYAKAQQHDTSLPLYLGGHSSGGGLMVNYATWDDRVVPAGYVLVSPQLGHLADIDRPVEKNSPPPFASVSILPFIINGIFGWMGHNHAVSFRYTEEHLRDGNVPSNTVNMANAITPTAPKAQFEQLNKSTDVVVSYQLVIGSDDELFVPEKVVAYAKPGHGEILEGENHLGILVKVHETIGAWMDQQLLVG